MPVYAALTSGDPPQYEFLQINNNKYAKLTGGNKVFKFANIALLTEAKTLACRERGFGLYQITRRDFGTGWQPIQSESIKDFTTSLAIIGWCDPCGDFTFGIMAADKCRHCDKTTR